MMDSLLLLSGYCVRSLSALDVGAGDPSFSSPTDSSLRATATASVEMLCANSFNACWERGPPGELPEIIRVCLNIFYSGIKYTEKD